MSVGSAASTPVVAGAAGAAAPTHRRSRSAALLLILGLVSVAPATRSVSTTPTEDQLGWEAGNATSPSGGSNDEEHRRLQAACVPGQRYDSTAGACVACVAGYAQPAGGHSSCNECSAGEYSTGKSLSLSAWTQVAYDRQSWTWCSDDGDKIHEYATAAEAMAACWLDVACVAVWALNCDGSEMGGTPHPAHHPTHWTAGDWTTCRSATGSSSSYDASNICLYTPPPGHSIGSAACASCPAGTFSGSGAGTCTACPAGYAQPAVGQSRCVECSANSYSAGSVQLSAWTKVPDRYCPAEIQGASYHTAVEALAACVLDTQCLSVYDVGCEAGSGNEVNWKTCHSATGSAGVCVHTAVGVYTPPSPGSSGSAACASCPAGKIQPYGSGGEYAFDAEHADDASDCFFDCAAGTSVSAQNEKAGCVPCPFPERCLGQNCSAALHATGNLCGSCAQGYYSAGQFCAKCADSPWLTMLAATVGLAGATVAVWKLSKQEPYKPPSTVDVGKKLGQGVASIAGQAKQTQQAIAMQSRAAAGSNSRSAVPSSTVITMGRSAQTLVASIVWPHFTYSLLPLMLPNMHWPYFVTDTVKWFRSLAFLDVGIFAEPGCFNSGASSANKALTRLGLSHGGFWLVIAGFTFVRCAGKCTEQRLKISQRAVNAAVFAFLLAHALLLRSCLVVMHCVENKSNDYLLKMDEKRRSGPLGNDTAVGRLQSDPDTACDLRTTWLLIWLMLALLITLFASTANVASLVKYRARRSARRAAPVPALATSVTVPIGVASGQPMLINTMAGQMQVVVPQGFGPGMVFQVPLPAPDLRQLKAQLATKRAQSVKRCASAVKGCAWLPAMIQLLRLLCSPEDSLSAAEYLLPAFGTIGTIVYGCILPLVLHYLVQKNINDGRLDDPDFRARYGYLISRFKHGKWGSEFRILSRKTALLLVTTILAEYAFLVAPAQLITLGWAFYKQWKERPFAEVGSKKQAFERDTPTGWSRGDVLEALSLGSQIGINLIALTRFKADEVVHAPDLSMWSKASSHSCDQQTSANSVIHSKIKSYATATEALDACWADENCLSVEDNHGPSSSRWSTCRSDPLPGSATPGGGGVGIADPGSGYTCSLATGNCDLYTPPAAGIGISEFTHADQGNDATSLVIALATLVFFLIPVFYGIHIVLVEWRVGRHTKRQTQRDTSSVALNSNRRHTRNSSGLSDSLMGEEPPMMEMIELTSSPAETGASAPAAAGLSSVATTDHDAIEELLRVAHLTQYTEALRRIGCVMPEDLCDLEESEMIGLGMKKIEIKRLLRTLK
eukprot:COSAG01_NODE_442_length_17020_cov_26.699622_10_plen_1296_part_00